MGCTAVPAGCSGAFRRPEDFPSGALGCSQPWSSPARQGEWRTAGGRARGPSGLWAVGLTCRPAPRQLPGRAERRWRVRSRVPGALPEAHRFRSLEGLPGGPRSPALRGQPHHQGVSARPSLGASPEPRSPALLLHIDFVVLFTPGRQTCSKRRHTSLYCAFLK